VLGLDPVDAGALLARGLLAELLEDELEVLDLLLRLLEVPEASSLSPTAPIIFGSAFVIAFSA
jgi:hypothetical protein